MKLPIPELMVKLFWFSLALFLLTGALEAVFPGPWWHEQIWAMLIFFTILTGILGLLAVKLMTLEMFNAVSVILGVTVIRLVCSIGFVFLILWGGDENLLWFVVDFFIIYLLYLLFDIYGLITNLRLHSK